MGLQPSHAPRVHAPPPWVEAATSVAHDRHTPVPRTRLELRAALVQAPPFSLSEATLRRVDALLQHEHAHERATVKQCTPMLEFRGSGRVLLHHGDITRLAVDAIMNAANAQLLGCFRPAHRCLDNVVHCAAGPRLRRACARVLAQRPRHQPRASTTWPLVITPGFCLPAAWVCHCVGPVWNERRGAECDKALLAQYTAMLDAAAARGWTSVALASLSTGLYGFPKPRAAQLVVPLVWEWSRRHQGCTVIITVYTDDDRRLYAAQLCKVQHCVGRAGRPPADAPANAIA